MITAFFPKLRLAVVPLSRNRKPTARMIPEPPLPMQLLFKLPVQFADALYLL
jgi:hypothetical protein